MSVLPLYSLIKRSENIVNQKVISSQSWNIINMHLERKRKHQMDTNHLREIVLLKRISGKNKDLKGILLFKINRYKIYIYI